jgi:hypothetical protein
MMFGRSKDRRKWAEVVLVVRGLTSNCEDSRVLLVVDNIGDFINKYGSPAPRGGVDKLPEFINSMLRTERWRDRPKSELIEVSCG